MKYINLKKKVVKISSETKFYFDPGEWPWRKLKTWTWRKSYFILVFENGPGEIKNLDMAC